MTYRKTLLLSAYVLFALVAQGAFLMAQTGQETGGIPIDDPLVIAKCGGCHTRNDNGAMIRISYVRTTPEIWEQIIKRMVRLNGLTLSADDARHIVRYLSNNNGLSPEEEKPAFWMPSIACLAPRKRRVAFPIPYNVPATIAIPSGACSCSDEQPPIISSWRTRTWRSSPALKPRSSVPTADTPIPRICL